MIFINQSQDNNVILTLNEELYIPYSGANFLFEFKSKSSNQTVTFLSQDISTATTRYNQFKITETASTYVNLTGSTISIQPGWFSYVVRANEQFTLNPTGQTVEYGIGFCSGTTVEQNFIYGSGEQIFY